jgi:apolipoprotein N-acyltransferase
VRRPFADRPDWKAVAQAVGAGILICAALPPWGWWPLAFAGLVLLDRVLDGQPAFDRFRRGWLVGFTMLAPSFWWIHDLTLPGYFIAVLVYASVIGGAMVLVPPNRGRRLALPAAWVLAEAVRGAWPFGGVPLSTLAIGQVAGPLVGVVRLGGSLLLGGVTVVAAVAIAAAIARRWKPAIIAAAVVLVLVGWAAVAPRGHDTGRVIQVAFVQGGGPQGTRAINTDMREVFERHLRASEKIPPGMDLIVWPEDVVDVPSVVTENPEGRELSTLARVHHATLVAGVVETVDLTHFRNSAIAWGPNGQYLDRYEKVHRVPFGEWVPFRSVLKVFAGDSLPSKDALVGKGKPVLTTPAGKFGVVISWEVFFDHRARSAIGNGGQVLLNPTNGASFTGTLVQTQQIASTRLRAMETGRWAVQVAPTGFSAFVTPEGKVLERTSVSEQAVGTHPVHLREGLTLYNRWGEWPTLVAIVLALGGAWALARREPAPDEPDPSGETTGGP